MAWPSTTAPDRTSRRASPTPRAPCRASSTSGPRGAARVARRPRRPRGRRARGGAEPPRRRAVEREPPRADAAAPLARTLLARGEREGAQRVLEPVVGDFQADGLKARLRLEDAGEPELSEAFAALDAGDVERAIDLLLEALPSADGSKDDIRQVVIAVLDQLGVEHPLARETRRRLAAALY